MALRGLGLTQATPDIIVDYAPRYYPDDPTPVKKPYGIRLPYYRTGTMTTAQYRPENDPMCVLQPSGVFKCVRANGQIETYPGPSYPTTDPAPQATPSASEAGPFGLSGSAFKWVVLAGLAYAILKK